MRAGLGRWLLLLALYPVLVSAASHQLEKEFQNPPPSARPWVYWFWLNGNITSNGITADLEAMKRVGIGGVLIMEVDQGAPVGPVDFMSARWRELFKHVVAQARRLHIEVNMNNDAGWNGSGGPWIRPEQSMQKVVFSETNVAGPLHFDAVLPKPDVVAGYYEDIRLLAFPKVGAYRIPDIKTKAAYDIGYTGPFVETNLPAEMVIERGREIDLSAQMDSEGRVTWDVPEGEWTLLRIGHTCTGVENAPAPKSGRGLECDKLSKEGIEASFSGMMAKLAADNGLNSSPKMRRAIGGLV
ncbi:MAG: glycosyl hydrolase, partial [Limisphaerales bacterium]